MGRAAGRSERGARVSVMQRAGVQSARGVCGGGACRVWRNGVWCGEERAGSGEWRWTGRQSGNNTYRPAQVCAVSFANQQTE